jgi:hypothetical protein
MRITIERRRGKAKTGLFSSVDAFMIDLTIEFSRTELAAIEMGNLGKLSVLPRSFHRAYGYRDPDFFERTAGDHLFVGRDLLHKQGKPKTIFYGTTSPETDKAEDELRRNLEGLKRAIDNIVLSPNSKQTYEL